jgi:hypothetical protein
MWLAKRQYEDLLLSHKREIDILTAWIEQLQSQVGAVGHSPRAEPTFGAAAPPQTLYVSEDEQDLLDAREAGLIDDLQLEEGLRKMGFHNNEVVVNP